MPDRYTFYHERVGAIVSALKHLSCAASIEIDRDAASSVRCMTACFTTKADKVVYKAQSTYFDTLVRRDTAWLVQTRRIEVEYITRAGQAIEPMEPMEFPGAMK